MFKKEREELKRLGTNIQQLWDSIERRDKNRDEDKDGQHRRMQNLILRIITLEEKAIDAATYKKEIQLQTERDLERFKNKITDKYMQSIERLFDFMKELAIITSVSGNQKDVVALKHQFMKPYMEEKWEHEKSEKAAKIDNRLKSKGRELLDKREALKSKKLTAEQQGKTTKDIDSQIEILDFVIGG